MYEGSERLRVVKGRGSICVSQEGGGDEVGESECEDTWTPVGKDGYWRCWSDSSDVYKNCGCVWQLFNYNFRCSIRGKHTFNWKNCSVPLRKGSKRGTLTLDLIYSRSSIPHESCGLWWICGQWAYRQLPSNWTGTCYLGTLIPGVWLKQPTATGIKTIPPSTHRAKRSADNSFEAIAKGGNQKWGDEEWPAERIIQYYGPATWEPNVVGREPTYLTNRIVRLQAVVEIVTNKTAAALRLIGDQLTQLRTTVLQNRLALDYLLASEGGVCKKLNLSDCCVEIDDNGELIKALADDMEKVAHVPVQKWNGWRMDWFSNWLPQLGWLRGGIACFLLLISGCALLPCILPCMYSIVKQTAKNVAHHEMFVRYQALALAEEYQNL
ncbi:syncytin-2-like [Alligator sinensis]|uniref:Syncytin-2-like n=1 Tax=Alligator sinensis TaxID=38654 RepID=A0A3Q0FRY1_ALLSI|nr:syncytin-2-like [Alligator sinensis]